MPLAKHFKAQCTRGTAPVRSIILTKTAANDTLIFLFVCPGRCVQSEPVTTRCTQYYLATSQYKVLHTFLGGNMSPPDRLEVLKGHLCAAQVREDRKFLCTPGEIHEWMSHGHEDLRKRIHDFLKVGPF